jgi:hypothetical protein
MEKLPMMVADDTIPDEQPAYSGAKMVRAASVLGDGKVFSCEILANLFGLEAKRIRKMCAEGEIPFVRRAGRVWIIHRAGAQFLERHVRRDPKLPRAELREDAARLDPDVIERQPDLPAEPNLLTADEVRKIRRSSKPIDALAAEFNRTKSSISHIQSGERYASIK